MRLIALNLPTVGRASVLLLPMILALPAWAQSVPPEAQRTVEFYVQHPSLRSRVNSACLNDPGHLRNAADCWNAHNADLQATARETHKMAGDSSDPRTPAYWDKRPNERKFKLSYCQHMTPETAARALCLPAEQSFVASRNNSSSR